MPHRAHEPPIGSESLKRSSTRQSFLMSLLSWSAASWPRRRKTAPDREPSRDGEARTRSRLASLLSLSAASPWRRKAPSPDRKPSARGEVRAQSMLASLLSLSTAWMPQRRGAPPRHGEVKAAIMAALVEVAYYEDPDTRRPVDSNTHDARSVGLSYREIQRRVRAAYPRSAKVSMMTIRSYARDAKDEGRALPSRRPYSARRQTVH